MKRFYRTLAPLMMMGLTAHSPLRAQSEDALTKFFEGRTIAVKMDMPANKAGVDVYPDRQPDVNYNDYSQRVKRFGISLHSGDSAPVTKIKVKDKLVEFQLGGGGYGTSGDESDIVPAPALTPKSDKEKDLERKIKVEKDRDKKRDMQKDLDDLREHREHEDARLQAAFSLAQEERRQRIYQLAQQSGSRFNIRYPKGVQLETLTPDAVMAVLAKYVDFNPPSTAATAAPPAPASTPGQGGLHKGMLQDDVDALLGRPVEVHRGKEGSLETSSSSYEQGDNTIDALFVEGVLVRYTIRSK
ncbi:MAG TPA: hypothetical protein VG028_18790 [Terriglobia bacterium]|nr:hypothetical protein [Terriglobia bacterium]